MPIHDEPNRKRGLGDFGHLVIRRVGAHSGLNVSTPISWNAGPSVLHFFLDTRPPKRNRVTRQLDALTCTPFPFWYESEVESIPRPYRSAATSTVSSLSEPDGISITRGVCGERVGETGRTCNGTGPRTF